MGPDTQTGEFQTLGAVTGYPQSSGRRRALSLFFLGVAGIVVAGFVSLFIAFPGLSLAELPEALLSTGNNDPQFTAILYDIRLPRVLLAIIAGGALSVSGVVFQALLRNVLADPYILGISAGSATGAYVANVLGLAALSIAMIPLSAFVSSLLVAGLVFGLSRSAVIRDGNTLLLSGVMVGTFLASVLLIILSLERSGTQSTLLWLLGSLSNARMTSVLLIAPIVLLITLYLQRASNTLNLLSLGSDTARSLGLNARRAELVLYVCGCLLSGTVISFTGAIGFVGLVIPHIVRLLIGADHRLLVPASFVYGGLFLLIADMISRLLLYPVELPVGAITALLGAPLFMYLLKRA